MRTVTASARRNQKEAFVMSPKSIRSFLLQKKEEGRSQQTVETYRRNLNSFWDFLDEEKVIHQDSLVQWKDTMIQEGYAATTINSRISAVNSFYDYIGRRNWQILDGHRAQPLEKQELTREEYFSLLREAKAQGNIQLYLLIKVLACTDLTPSDMPLLTREAAEAGIVTGKERGTSGVLILPEPLRAELLEYADSRSISQGPLFINGNFNCHSRGTIMKMVSNLAAEAGLEPGKANPRSLRRLHLNTQTQFQKQAEAWVAAQYASLLNQEETIIGWQSMKPSPPHRQSTAKVP